MITYEIILEYLGTHVFSTQTNIALPSSKFTYFKNIFDDTFYRYGIQNTCNSKNVSLENSIKYCLNTTVDFPNNLWNIANLVHINIIIFDFKDNTILSAYYGEYFNQWRPTILLANYNDWWEPIMTNETRIFNFHKLFNLKNKILPNEIKKYADIKNNIIIYCNFNEIIELEQFINTNQTFINNTTFTKNKLEKMKKDEILQIILNMNITIDIVKPNKKDLIKLICKE